MAVESPRYAKPIDYWVDMALDTIKERSGRRCGVVSSLLQFGANDDVDQAYETIMTLPSGVNEETYVSDNLITEAVSDNAADNQPIVIAGHTVSNGNFTRADDQTITLNGTTPVSLTTPLARVHDAENVGSSSLQGTVSIQQAGGAPAAVHLQIKPGENRSLKAAFTTAQDEWLLVTRIYASISDKSASSDAGVDFRVREQGGVFRTAFKDAVSMGTKLDLGFEPFAIVAPNSDVLVRAIGNQNNTPVSAGFNALIVRMGGQLPQV